MEALVARRPYLLSDRPPWGMTGAVYMELLQYAIDTGQTRALRTLVRWSFGQQWLVPVIQHAFFALARFPSVTKNMIDAFRPYQAHLQLACDESGNTVFHFFATAAGPRTHYYVRHLLHTWKCANARAPNRAGVTAGELFAQTGQLRCARLCGYSPRNGTGWKNPVITARQSANEEHPRETPLGTSFTIPREPDVFGNKTTF